MLLVNHVIKGQFYKSNYLLKFHGKINLGATA